MMASLTILILAPLGETRCAEAIDGPRPLRVRIVRGLPPAILEQAREEVEAIWRPHQIAIVWVATEMRATTDPPDLLVGISDRPPNGKTVSRRAIAWILFDDGRPTHFIQVSLRAAVALLDSRSSWDGIPVTTLYPGPRERALGRIIGRALAHEIGHYLLGSTGHSLTGLMRATLPDEELVAIGRIRMTLNNGDAKVLRARLQSMAAAAPVMARCR